MILSNTRILQAIKQKRFLIDPVLNPTTFSSQSGNPFKSSALDLRLGTEIAYFNDDIPAHIDLSLGSFAGIFHANSTRKTITRESPYPLKPGKLVLANTLETIGFPIMKRGQLPSLAGRIEGRSSYARCGLLVHFTAPTIHAGFSGKITLEMINLGRLPIVLTPGEPICQLIIEEVAGVPTVYSESQFQHQVHPGGEKN